MAQYNYTQLKARINAVITSNGNNAITGADHNQLLQDIIDSVPNLLSNAGSLGLTLYDPTYSYSAGDTCVYNNEIYLALQATQGTFNPAHWVAIPNTLANLPGVVVYDNADSYAQDDLVSYNGSIYRAKVATQGNLPTSTVQWELLAFNNGYGQPWQSNMYVQRGQVVDHHGHLLKCEADNYLVSTNIHAEIDQALWSMVGGRPVFNYVRGVHDYVIIMPWQQYVVHGDLEVKGTIWVQKNGQLIVTGTISGSGQVMGAGQTINQLP